MSRSSSEQFASYFYPRSPRGERHLKANGKPRPWKFLSTLPARGATKRDSGRKRGQADFYPRSPRGERQQKQRGKSLLLFHYTTLCTNLEELFLQKGKNWEIHAKLACYIGAKGTRKRWVLHLRTGWQARVKRAGDRPAQRAGERRRVRPCFGSGCPADRSADCPERGR